VLAIAGVGALTARELGGGIEHHSSAPGMRSDRAASRVPGMGGAPPLTDPTEVVRATNNRSGSDRISVMRVGAV
jgi:hypothetical protein